MQAPSRQRKADDGARQEDLHLWRRRISHRARLGRGIDALPTVSYGERCWAIVYMRLAPVEKIFRPWRRPCFPSHSAQLYSLKTVKNDGKPPKAPAHLRPATQKWWRSVLADFDLEDHHLRLLQLAAEAWDQAQGARSPRQRRPDLHGSFRPAQRAPRGWHSAKRPHRLRRAATRACP